MWKQVDPFDFNMSGCIFLQSNESDRKRQVDRENNNRELETQGHTQTEQTEDSDIYTRQNVGASRDKIRYTFESKGKRMSSTTQI